MATDRSLSPSDAAAAARSFPRRFRAVLARPDDADERFDPDEIGRRVGSDGRSAADHLLAADGVLALLDGALEQVARTNDDEVVVHPAFADLSAASWDDDHTPVPALLDQLEATATRAADRIDSVATDDWSTKVRVADAGAGALAIDVTQEAIGVVAGHLRAAQRTIDAVV